MLFIVRRKRIVELILSQKKSAGNFLDSESVIYLIFLILYRYHISIRSKGILTMDMFQGNMLCSIYCIDFGK